MATVKFYITTTLPYVNAVPHLGHALEFVQADAIVRYHKSRGEEVFFNTGTDEHGLKVYRKAQELHQDPQTYVDESAENFRKILADLGVVYTRFIRTTEAKHVTACQEFWRRCKEAGDIYLAQYKVKYCVGCELEKTDSELTDSKCPDHPNLAVEEREEENYFFRFSKYQQPLLDLYQKYPDFVLPAHRLQEIRNFVAAGLQDFSISRLKEKMPWGVAVPDDPRHVMYVWFDALINYISTLNWPGGQPSKFEDFWGTEEEPRAVQIAGKDNLRQQSAMWQAMLLSAGLPTSRQILIHGHIVSGGQKMSKTIGNVVDPAEIIRGYGADALRYWLLREMPTFEDGDFTLEKFKESYNANLANGLGNLVQRVLKMAAVYKVAKSEERSAKREGKEGSVYQELMEKYELQKATNLIWDEIQACDRMIQDCAPFKKFKTDPEAAKRDVAALLGKLAVIAHWLAPFLPATSQKIQEALESGQPPAVPLFPRIG
ncbi:MAG: methionine--tRNA ligase [Candidatus Liptonbacteria bacterium]|nr:methionine--tRNA ligase [Candidatus Liptonbacteria bacterium]